MAVSAQCVAQEYQIEVDELVEMAEYMEVDSAAEPFLLRIIAESMVQPLPAEWRECEDESSGQVYYFNEETKETAWERPVVRRGNQTRVCVDCIRRVGHRTSYVC